MRSQKEKVQIGRKQMEPFEYCIVFFPLISHDFTSSRYQQGTIENRLLQSFTSRTSMRLRHATVARYLKRQDVTEGLLSDSFEIGMLGE